MRGFPLDEEARRTVRFPVSSKGYRLPPTGLQCFIPELNSPGDFPLPLLFYFPSFAFFSSCHVHVVDIVGNPSSFDVTFPCPKNSQLLPPSLIQRWRGETKKKKLRNRSNDIMPIAPCSCRDDNNNKISPIIPAVGKKEKKTRKTRKTTKNRPEAPRAGTAR